MATTEVNVEDLRRHVGRRQVATDVITSGRANLLRLAFRRAEPEFQTGDPLAMEVEGYPGLVIHGPSR